MWVDLIQFFEFLGRTKRLNEREFSLCLTVPKLGHWSSLAFGLRLGLELTPLVLLVLRPMD